MLSQTKALWAYFFPKPDAGEVVLEMTAAEEANLCRVDARRKSILIAILTVVVMFIFSAPRLFLAPSAQGDQPEIDLYFWASRVALMGVIVYLAYRLYTDTSFRKQVWELGSDAFRVLLKVVAVLVVSISSLVIGFGGVHYGLAELVFAPWAVYLGVMLCCLFYTAVFAWETIVNKMSAQEYMASDVYGKISELCKLLGIFAVCGLLFHGPFEDILAYWSQATEPDEMIDQLLYIVFIFVLVFLPFLAVQLIGESQLTSVRSKLNQQLKQKVAEVNLDKEDEIRRQYHALSSKIKKIEPHPVTEIKKAYAGIGMAMFGFFAMWLAVLAKLPFWGFVLITISALLLYWNIVSWIISCYPKLRDQTDPLKQEIEAFLRFEIS